MNDAPVDYAAVQHILKSPSISARTAPYIGAHEFDWHGLLREAETTHRAARRSRHDLQADCEAS